MPQGGKRNHPGVPAAKSEFTIGCNFVEAWYNGPKEVEGVLLDPIRLKEKLDKRLQADLAAGRVDGVAVSVMQDGQLLYETHVGIATEQSLFRMASMTKPVTAAAVLLLMQRGKLGLSDPVMKFLPGFPPQLQLIHLLSHSSGLSQEYYVNHIADTYRADANLLVDFVASLPFDFAPGTAAAYSPVAAYALLTAIIEQTACMDFPTFVQREIFDPCEMENTTFLPTRQQWARLIPMQGGGTVPGCVFERYPVTNPIGGAGMVSSLRDYQRFAQMLLDGNGILSRETLRIMTTPVAGEDPVKWGCGVRVITGNYRLPVGAFGWSGAYGTHFWADPVNRITAVYLKNSRFDGGASAQTAANFECDVMDCLTQTL